MQKARIFSGIKRTGRRIKSNIGTGLRNVEEGIRDLVIDAEHIGTMLHNRELRRQALSLPKNARDYEIEMTGIVDDSYKRRLKGKYGPVAQKIKSLARPFVGMGGIALANETLSPQQNTKKRLKKGLVNPTLHEIRRANPTPTRQSVKYAPSTYAQSVAGMAGSGRNRNSDKLRQLMEDASTLSTGGRPNPEHNDKRFYGLFGQSAINEPQKSMSKLQLQQRQIKQDLREGHANRRVAKSSSLKKGSYGNVFVSGASVDPMMIVQPKKGRRFKGQTMGMTLVSKRAKTIRKDDSENIYDNSDFGDLATAALTSVLGGLGSFYLGQSLQKPKRKRPYNPDGKSTISVTTDATTKVPASTYSVKPTAPTTTPPYVTSTTSSRKTTPWRQFNRYLANLERNVVDASKNAWNSWQTKKPSSPSPKTNYNATVNATNANANVRKPTASASAPKVGIGRKALNAIGGGLRGVGVANTIADVGTTAGTIDQIFPNIINAFIPNTVNTSRSIENEPNYKKPILVNTERYDVRSKKWRNDPSLGAQFVGNYENSKKDDANSYLSTQYVPSPSGGIMSQPQETKFDASGNPYLDSTNPNKVTGYGDSESYNVSSFEQLPTRVKQEQARFTIPVETRIQPYSNTVLNSAVQEGVNLVDPWGLTAMLMGNNTYNDYGEPVLGGRTMYRTSLFNSLGERPNSYVTGWSKSNSRDGQQSLSAQGAINLYKDKHKNDIEYFKNQENKYTQDVKNIDNEIDKKITDFQNLPASAQTEELQSKVQSEIDALYQQGLELESELNNMIYGRAQTEKAFEALNQIGSRVNSLKGLQEEIEVARANNNTPVLNLLTEPRMFMTADNPLPPLYDLAGYQNPLRRIQISRVGDKYGDNLMPFSIRSTEPQITQYVDNINNSGEQALNSLATFAGVAPYGKKGQQHVDNDWMVGMGLSNYQGDDPRYKNINTQAVYVDSDPRVDVTHQPINPARTTRLEDIIFAKPVKAGESPYGRLSGKDYANFHFGTDQRVDNRNLGTILSERGGNAALGLSSIFNPGTYAEDWWKKNRPDLFNSLSKRKSTKKTKSVSKNASVKKSSRMQSSLTQSQPMSPIGNAPPVKMTQSSNSVASTASPQPQTGIGSPFMKSLNQNPKPIEPVHVKHKNKYFK